MVSYTRLMEADEIDTHSRLRSLKVSLIDPTVISHRGEVVKGTGDGFIAVFESPSDALHCAVELQSEITATEAGHLPETRLVFRMALNWEPVILDEHDVFGSGVNIASRLQTEAPAGGIITTKSLLDAIDDAGGILLDDLGDLRLKNLLRPVHAFSLRLPGLGSAPGALSRRLGSARLPSIAVLPFLNLTPGGNADFIASGFAEDVITGLSSVPELLVVSRASTFGLHPTVQDPTVVTEKLGVRYVLKGTVRRHGDDVRIVVEFIDCESGSLIWAERFDVAVHEIFGLQQEVAQQVACKVTRGVQRTEITRTLRAGPHTLNAYDYFIRALDLLYKLDFASFDQARKLLQQAQEEDPGYAAPFAYAAHWHMFKLCEGWSSDPEYDNQRFMALSEQALERDPFNALALTLHGHGRSMFRREYEPAMDMFDRALTASPSNSWAWVFSSGTYGFIGDAKAGIARAERAIRLSPLDQQAFFNYCLLAQNHYLNGTYQEAARWARRSFGLNPRFGNTHRVLAASLVALGDETKAREIIEVHNRTLPHFRLSDYKRRCPFAPDDATLYVERLGRAGVLP